MKKKKIHISKILFVVVVIAIIVLLLLLFDKLIGNDDTISFNIESSKKRASEISELYKDDYNSSVLLKDSNINKSGSYELKGNYKCIKINTNLNVNLVLNNANIVCDDGPAIYVENAKTLHVVLKGENSINSTTNIDLEGAIYSKDDLVFTGDGSLNITSNYEGIVSNDNLVIKGGKYSINSFDDGIKGKDVVAIVDGEFIIKSHGDGIKSSNSQNKSKGYITIDNGKFDIDSLKDGLQAETDILIDNGVFKIKTNTDSEESSKAIKANSLIEIKNGTFDINSIDDGINSGGNMKIDGGDFSINSNDEGIKVTGLFINSGNIKINSTDGIKASYFRMDNGLLSIQAKDEGITTIKDIKKYNATYEMNDGSVAIQMGPGSKGGIVCPGNLIMHGGTLNVAGDLPFELSGTVSGDGGTIIRNGEKIENISSIAPRKKTGNNNNKQSSNNDKQNSSTRDSSSHSETNENGEHSSRHSRST